MASERDELIQIAAAIYGDVDPGSGESRAGIAITEALEIMREADKALAEIKGREFVDLNHHRVRGTALTDLVFALEASGIGVRTDLTMRNRPAALSVPHKDYKKAMKIVDAHGLHKA